MEAGHWNPNHWNVNFWNTNYWGAFVESGIVTGPNVNINVVSRGIEIDASGRNIKINVVNKNIGIGV